MGKNGLLKQLQQRLLTQGASTHSAPPGNLPRSWVARFGRASTQPSLPLIIAGYNGGGDSVERWIGGYTTAPEPDRFAEDISFTETRRYVRRVLGFLMAYRRAYGDR